jgi:16S rRNA (guanine527-N7)-methyltransferase
VLGDAQQRGLIGPGEISDHLDHSLGFVEIVSERGCERVIDLGTGGGLPGLVLAAYLESPELSLLDGSERRMAWLEEALGRLGLLGVVSLLFGRAEELGHEAHLRGAFDCVTARAFGQPAATAECAAGFLAPGGVLLVSEPPVAEAGRWSESGLAELGFRPPERLMAAGHSFVLIELAQEAPERYPRRVGVPQKRPLF